MRVCEQGDTARHEQEAADREEEKADQYQCPAEDEGVAAHALRSGRGDVHLWSLQIEHVASITTIRRLCA